MSAGFVSCGVGFHTHTLADPVGQRQSYPSTGKVRRNPRPAPFAEWVVQAAILRVQSQNRCVADTRRRMPDHYRRWPGRNVPITRSFKLTTTLEP